MSSRRSRASSITTELPRITLIAVSFGVAEGFKVFAVTHYHSELHLFARLARFNGVFEDEVKEDLEIFSDFEGWG